MSEALLLRMLQQMPWAIVPETLETICEILYHRYYGPHDIAKIELDLGRKLDNEFKPYTASVQCGWDGGNCGTGGAEGSSTVKAVRIVPIHGTIAKRMNLFHAISGGTSIDQLNKEITGAAFDDAIDAIVLDVDSPGGTVDGTMELSETIYSLRERKPIVAYANGLMASAAYWLGVSASEVMAYDTSQVGSIGVITVHYDMSRRDEAEGVRRTILHAGKYKAVGNDAGPLDKESRSIIQDRLDRYYEMFVDGVARMRGVDAELVSKKWADGRVFLARDAVENGMIDRIGTLNDAIERAANMSRTIEQEYANAVPIRDEDVE